MSDLSKKNSYVFIDYLRVMGMLFISWPHLTAIIYPEWRTLEFIQRLFNEPLSIIQNFGALGVSIFFCISGFLLAENKDANSQFLKKKIIKLYCPVVISIFIFATINKMIEILFSYHSYWSQFSILDYFKSAFLWSFLTGSSDPVDGVLWYLLPLTFLYIFHLLYNTSTVKKPQNFCFFVNLCILSFYYFLPKSDFNFTGVLNYLPYTLIPIFGYQINLLRQSKIHLYNFIASIFINYFCLVYGFYKFQTHYYYSAEPYLTSTFLAILIFTVASLIKPLNIIPKTVSILSKISFSFYIIHSLYGGFIISLTIRVIPYSICLILGYFTAIIAAYVNYNLVEVPLKKLLIKNKH